MLKVLITMLTLGAAAALCNAKCINSKVYDGTIYLDKSSIIKDYLNPITIIYGHKLYPNNKWSSSLPPYGYAKKHVAANLVPESELIVYDIEHWPIRGLYSKPEIRLSNINKYLTIAKELRQWSDKKISLFGLFPVDDFEGLLQGRKSQRYRWWEEDNIATKDLVHQLDFFSPSLYTYSSDHAQWERVADIMIKRSRLFSTKKPVFVFIWPQYFDHHPTPRNLQTKFIPPAQWLNQLEYLYDKVDGIIIWGGWDFKRKRHDTWDSTARWWIDTKSFLKQTSKCGAPITKSSDENKSAPLPLRETNRKN